MNESLNKLAKLFQKESRLVIGLMSGTSLDGLDIALCKISGSGLAAKARVLHFETISYPDDFKEDLKTVFAKQEVSLQKLTLLNAKIGSLHAEMVQQFLKKRRISAVDIDCIASHGQTIYHAPKRLHQQPNYPNATLQIGDADHIAVKTGVVTISDFRQKHIASGGEGAPLALYGDYILFSSETENRVLLNIGGISNFTYLPINADLNEITCSDAGPGNTLIDALCKRYFNLDYDSNGDIARKGQLIPELLDELLAMPFFTESLPKTTGPELFNLNLMERVLCDKKLDDFKPKDLIHTATQFTVQAIVNSLQKALKKPDFTIYISGGGAKNSFLMECLSAELTGVNLKNIEELGVEADAKEALLFALLANETICGSALAINSGQVITMGKISLPE